MGPCSYRELRASAHKVNVLSLLYILRGLNHNWNVKWTLKRSLIFTSPISYNQIEYIACYTQYIYYF